MKIFALLISCAALAFFAGCSTPETRINENVEFFSRLSPGDQQLIREGKVAVGFTPVMVRMAVGEPDRVFTRTDAKGVTEAWSYTTYETDDGVILYSGLYHHYWGDPLIYPYYTGYSNRRAKDYLKVVFTGGLVSSIESRS
jgi:hypothetical protein